ncbi:phage tail protein [Paenibacillus massiliensis]|uniref:phage tail protein n=1 Tax=Paenibacillus massiliensis TaxID=225917 RepID=UPI000366D78D|nr:tail fiber protein [Paenibacillus massiliensis]
MGEGYLGEIRLFAGDFAPEGWALCNGQLLLISANEALFSLIGTTYGGDGQTNFALPDLQGRVAVHRSQTNLLGQKAGSETVTLASSQLPAHTHIANAWTGATDKLDSPENALWGDSPRKIYFSGTPTATVNMNASTVSSVGGNQPHDNMMPSTAISFIICLEGVYPSQF